MCSDEFQSSNMNTVKRRHSHCQVRRQARSIPDIFNAGGHTDIESSSLLLSVEEPSRGGSF